MTTIAYRDRIIAYDSRFVCGDVIEDDDGDKHYEIDGIHFFLSGDCSDYDSLIESYVKNESIKKIINARALVVDDGKLYTCSVTPDGDFWRCIERLDHHMAIGSGKNFVLAFMDTGMSAEEAVKATCKRDLYTGGTIRIFKLYD